MNKEIIAEFDIKTSDLLEKATATKYALDELRAQQKIIAKEQGTNSKAYVETAVNIKVLSSEYNAYTKTLGASINQEKSLNDILKEKNTSISAARANNKLLLASRNALDLSTTKGIAKQKEINDKINQNNKFIEKNVSELEKQKIGIGGYEKAIDNALGKISLFGVSLSDVRKKAASFGETIKDNKKKLVAQSVASGTASTATKGLSASIKSASLSLRAFSIALVSTGVGAFVVAAGLLVAVISKAISNSRDFAVQQSKLGAILGKSKSEITELKELTKEYGKTTEFTATQVTEAAVELAKAGFSQEEIMESLAATLQLAAAGNISLAESADIASNVVTGFGLKASDTQKVVDILAKSSTSANVTVRSMGESFKEIASTAAVLNVPIEEVAATIDALGNSGIKGTNATNVLQSSLLRLADPTKKARAEMKHLNVEFFDANGEFIGLTDTVSLLEDRFKTLTKEQQLTAVSSIFGKNSANQWLTVMNSTKDVMAKDLTPETRKLLNITDENSKVTLKGSDVLKVYTSEMKNAQGAGKALAAEMQNNLTGDITKLSSAWDGLFLTIEDGDGVLTDIARFFTQYLTDAINDFTKVLFSVSFAWNEFKTMSSNTLDLVVNNFKVFSNGIKLLIGNIPIIGKALDIDTESVKKEMLGLINEIKSSTDKIEEQSATIIVRYNNDDAERIEKQNAETSEERKEREKAEAKLKKENAKKAKKTQEDAIKQQEVQLQLFELISEQENTSLSQKKQGLQDVLNKELEIIQAKQDAGLSVDEAELLRMQARQKAIEGNTELILDSANKELELHLLNNQHILDSEDNLNANLISKRKSLIDETAKLELAALEAQGLSKEEFDAKRDEIERNRKLENKEEDDLLDEITKKERDEKAVVDFENKLIRLEEEDATLLEIEQLKRERDKEIAIQEVEDLVLSEQDKALRISAINKKADEEDKASKQALKEQKLQLAADTLGGISDLLGEETEAGKVAAIAQSTINTYQGVTQVWRAPSTLPEPFGTAQKVISTGIVLKSGFDSVKKIKETKAAKGISFQGTLSGASHANGGIDLGNGVEAEGGENYYTDGSNGYIMNKQASSLVNQKGLLGALSYINQKVGGGIPLTTPTSYANNGGLVSSRIKQNARSNFPSEEQQTIKVINIAEETANIVNDSIRVKNMANL